MAPSNQIGIGAGRAFNKRADLARYLRDGASLPFVWGERDCCLWACEWVRARRGVDPSAPLRGRYSTGAGALRHVDRGGGLEALVRRRFAAAGLSETAAPEPGDVGVIEAAATGMGLALAIRTANGWAAKSPAGVTVAAFPCRVAWSV